MINVDKTDEYWKAAEGFPAIGRKLKILVNNPNKGGCAYYRSLLPLQKLQEHYPNVVEVRFNENPLGLDEKTGGWLPDWKFEDMHWADIILANNISNFGGNYTARVCGKAREFGKVFWMDTDDLLTELYEGHRLKEVYDKSLSDITKFIYYHSDIVTVTQRKFADKVKPFMNKGILAVVKNCIDYNLQCWRMPKVPVHKKGYTRFGWAGGIHHEEDVKVFSGVPAFVNQRVGTPNCQWDFYGKPPNYIPPAPFSIKLPKLKKGESYRTNVELNEQIKVLEERFKDHIESREILHKWIKELIQWENDAWQHDVWINYEKRLMRGHKGPKNWNIHHALNTDQYGVFYAQMDIALAPLQMNAFNDSKSEIKVAECGRYGVPLVASDVGCYDEWIRDYETGILIPHDAPITVWVKVLSDLAKNPHKVKKMGDNLKLITDEMFDINKQAFRRLNVLESFYHWKNKPIEVTNEVV